LEAAEWLGPAVLLRREADDRDVWESSEKGQASDQTRYEEALDKDGHVHSR